MAVLLFGERVDKKYLELQTKEEKKRMAKTSAEIKYELETLVIGQQQAVDAVMPFIQMFQVDLNPEGRPVGVILLMGPTGSGKTHLVEKLAEILHGNPKSLIKIDCGEYQMDHEVAKLIGAPPGYLGHRETNPLFTQAKLNGVASEECGLQLVLFDEIEKAAPALTRLLMAVLDKGTLRLGDNTSVNFERSLIVLTSNLGASAIKKANSPDFGLEVAAKTGSATTEKLKGIGISAVKKKFSPEFVNRIDSIVTYNSLTRNDCSTILDHIGQGFLKLIKRRLGVKAFKFKMTERAADVILDMGTSAEYGARELKRTFQKVFSVPVAAMLEDGKISPLSMVTLDHVGGNFKLTVK